MRKLISVVLVVLLLAPLVNALATSEIDVAALAENLDLLSLEDLQVIQEEVEKAIQRKQPSGSTQQQPLLSQKAEKVTVKALHDAYEKNSISADAKYNGKLLEVTGYVKGIEKELWGDRIYVSIAQTDDSWDFDTVSCYLAPEENGEAAKLEKGNRVVISGICDGEAFMSITMNECSIVSSRK